MRRKQGRFDEALDVRRRAHQLAGDDWLLDAFETARGEEGYRSIDRTAVERELDILRARADAAYVSPLDFARAHARLGNREEAQRKKAECRHQNLAPAPSGLVFLKVDPAWDLIRDDPRFTEAIRRVGLP